MTLVIVAVIIYIILLIAFTIIPTTWYSILIFGILSVLIYHLLFRIAEKRRLNNAIYTKNNPNLLKQEEVDFSNAAQYHLEESNNHQVDINNIIQYGRPTYKIPFKGISMEAMKNNLKYQTQRLYEYEQTVLITDLMIKSSGIGLFEQNKYSIYGQSKFGYLKMGVLDKNASKEFHENYDKIIFIGIKFKYGKYRFVKVNENKEITTYSDYQPYEVELVVVYK